MYASLSNSFARANRAQQHLTQLERELISFWRSADLPDAREHGVTGTVTFITGVLVPDTFSILVEECIYNLRAALDYLVYELAISSLCRISGIGCLSEFARSREWLDHLKQRKNYLKGLTEEHKAMFKQLQPFPQSNWTKTLQEVSNPDKHRTLNVVNPSQRITTLHSDDVPDYYLSFDDGSPVTQTLQDLQVRVSAVLESFNGIFQ